MVLAAPHQDGMAEEIQRWRAFALWRLGSLGLDAEHGDAQPFSAGTWPSTRG
jgi:hypothetical protein